MTRETGRPLDGRAILVTRPAGRGEKLAAILEELGARVDLRPTIAFEPPRDPEPARRAIARIASYDVVVFTSATGVRAFSSFLGGESSASVRRVAAIGPETARSLSEIGLTPEILSREGRSEDLASLLAATSPRRVLVVRPEVGRDLLSMVLEDAGASVDAVPFYRTVAANGARQVADDLARGLFDAVVFTSPSSFERLRDAAANGDALKEGLRRTRRIAIGAYTASVLEAAGLPADATADTPSDTGIADAVVRAFALAR